MIWLLYLPLTTIVCLLAFPLAPIIALFADGQGDVTLSDKNPLRLWLTPDNPIEGDSGHFGGRGLLPRIRKSACTFSVSHGYGGTKHTDGDGRYLARSSVRTMSYCNAETARRTTIRFIRAFGLRPRPAIRSRRDGCFT